MPNFQVTFTQNWVYDVEADTEEEAYDKAYREFLSEMSRSIAHTQYDEVEVECTDEESDDDWDDEQD